LGRYGAAGNSPYMDELAERSMVMDRHQSCSAWTYPSVLCALTGQLPYSLGFMPVPTSTEGQPPLPEGTPTLAGLLVEAGYQTSLVTTSMWLSSTMGLDAGYQTEARAFNRSAAQIRAEAEGVMAELSPTRPWLLHVHFRDPHGPYEAPESYLKALEGRPELRWDLSTTEGEHAYHLERGSESEATRREGDTQMLLRYLAEVRYLDDELAAMMATFEAQGRLDDTLVVLWSDHGEQFWEHEEFQHNNSLHTEENDAIFLISGPDVKAEAWTQSTSGVDILPTLLQHLGQPIPDGLPGCPVGKAKEDRPQFAVRQSDDAITQAVTVGSQKLIYAWSGSFSRYDREVDPEERVDLYQAGGEEEAALWPLLKPEVAALQAVIPEETPQGLP
ncbi:MAG TPA: sulfatase-like hydrolase/transferase, partial [Myxococcota bacterium]|nr:sulfatase-like hydrolase/transferase [Myxococcota bacterium]